MKSNRYQPVIGMEVHLELNSSSKMFCSCPAFHFRVKANSHTCPVCLGLPGALPVANKKAIDWCLQIGLALNCRIKKESKFDRKNYFYPDLAKGYQISQYDQPFCQQGFLEIKSKTGKKKIGIERVHMEEDTGKLIHKKIKGKKVSLVDFNRSGVPLVEVVSKPEINSSLEAVSYLKKLRQIVRYLGVSDCDMEKGSMRCEVNISLKQKKDNSNYKVEVKNLNSFRFVKKAINYEIKRQEKILLSGKMPIQETRGFNETEGKTFSQRTKEEAQDYRYFPEPDIPPIKIKKAKIKKLKKSLPELPDQKIKRFVEDYGLSEYNAEILTAKKEQADYFDQLADQAKNKQFLKKLAKIIVNKRVDISKYNPSQLIKQLKKQKKARISDKKELSRLIKEVIEENKPAVADFNQGKKEVIGFLIGQVMKKSKGKAKALLVKKLLLEKLSKAS